MPLRRGAGFVLVGRQRRGPFYRLFVDEGFYDCVELVTPWCRMPPEMGQLPVLGV